MTDSSEGQRPDLREQLAQAVVQQSGAALAIIDGDGEPAPPKRPRRRIAPLWIGDFDYDGLPPKIQNSLRRIAKEVKAKHWTHFGIVYRLGALLERAKRQLPHGQFQSWVEAECGIGRRAAAKSGDVFAPNQQRK